MRNVLIVDDEKNIRLGLRAMIEREFQGRFAALLASDGEEALKELSREKIDLMITDIRMPNMDGIELINRVRELENQPSVIILSGHDDFAYAKEAIRCEVKEYLLKPIVRSELFQALNRLDRELERKEEQSALLESSLKQQEDYQESQLRIVLLQPELPASDIHTMLGKAGLDWLDGDFRIAVLKPDDVTSTGKRPDLKAAVDSLLTDEALEADVRWLRFYDKDGQLVVAANHEKPFRLLAEHALGRNFLAFRMGLGAPTSGMEHLKPAYEQALKAMKYTFLQANPSFAAYENMKDLDTGYTLPAADIQKLANMLGSDREKEMKLLLHQLLDIRTVSRYDLAYLEAVSAALNELVFDKVFYAYGEESIEILKLYKMVGNIYNFNHYHDYVHGVESLLFQLNEYVKTMKAAHVDNKEMKRALAFIQENYHKDLNMATVSNHVSLNYTYFSESFKQYTGESFVNYLKKIRIENAKRLLETTDQKVYEIGEKVGFENTKNFNRVFKEMEGVTPLEYRERRHMFE
ncbi:response regulator [Cohnella sp. CFH 77786]|uniref:response regulator n=1 Tax=Cohnella sp. CFH 77786 TaxID=2662265 RepID=UPI001C60B9F2|nr:response regulator [Cohnella sp. CFH 77786]MBW5448219.1 response regulator [Cohnella sp. CFH 77786]